MTTQILGLSLLQPWASLMALGEKRVETRSWSTTYRGLIAIAASKKFGEAEMDIACEHPAFLAAWRRHGILHPSELPRGKVLCVGRLVDVVPTDGFDFSGFSDSERFFGNYDRGRYAWIFEGVKRVPPIAVRGALGLYPLDEDVVADLRAHL